MEKWEREKWERETYLENKKSWIDELRNFRETGFMPIKQYSMRITKETTLGEIIHDNTLTPDDCSRPSITIHGGKPTLMVTLKKKRTFEDYVKEYFHNGTISVLQPLSCQTWRRMLISGPYDDVPFEVRVGLVKFICDQNGMDYIQVIRQVSKIASAAPSCLDSLDSVSTIPIKLLQSVRF